MIGVPDNEQIATPLGERVFESCSTDYDACVHDSDDIDRFCSSHAFVVAALLALAPGRPARIFSVGDNGYLAFAERQAALFGDPRPRRLWEPLEAMWGLCSPLVGTEHEALASALAHVLANEGQGATALLCGMKANSQRLTSVVYALSGTHRLVQGTSTGRVVASLENGVDGFLSRRSTRFRSNLRRTIRNATAAGIVQEVYRPSDIDETQQLYERATRIDDASWKGRSDTGLRASGLYSFYAEMLPRLAARGALCMYFLVEDGQDLAYLFGGIFDDTFRGLQFAFVADRAADSLGNLAQYEAIVALAAERVQRYDLGTAVEYKRHWGELLEESVSVIAIPRGRP